MVPEGWVEKTLDKIVAKNIVYGIVQAGEHIEGGIPYIKSADVGNGIDSAHLARTHPEIHRKYRRSAVGPGDLVISLRGNTGSVSLVPDTLHEANLTQGTARISVSKDYDQRFIRYQLASSRAAKAIWRVSKGSTFTEISLEELRKLKLSLPPLPEQKKIADILSTWDKAMDTTEELLANAAAQKRSLMQQLLTGKTRLNKFQGRDLPRVLLADATAFIRDGTHGTHVRHPTGIPMISAVSVTPEHTIDLESAPRISEADYDAIHRRYEIANGDLLLTIVGTIGRTALANGEGKFTAQRSVAIIRPGKRLQARYLAQLARSGPFQEQLRRRSNVTAQPGIYLGELAKIEIPLPDIEEQVVLADILEAADGDIHLQRCRLQNLHSEKRALMQQLLTGKRRVTV